MNIFVFRILIDDQDDFIREIEIESTRTFKDLHDFIVKSLKLGGEELASFHIADHNWKKLKEITLIDMTGKPGKQGGQNHKTPKTLIMSKTRLDSLLFDIEQKLLYEYDFLQLYTFRLEVVDMKSPESGKAYPRLSYSKGALQLRENVKVEKDPEQLKQELLKEFNSMLNNDDDDDFGEDDDY